MSARESRDKSRFNVFEVRLGEDSTVDQRLLVNGNAYRAGTRHEAHVGFFRVSDEGCGGQCQSIHGVLAVTHDAVIALS